MMIKSKRCAWSSNEFFAHKKNQGEEAKLRGKITSIDRMHCLVKDALKHDISEVKTSLRNLRKSTGHSIEALPPTPFRFDARRFSILPLVTRDSCSTLVPAEYAYVADEVDDFYEMSVMNGTVLDDDVKEANDKDTKPDNSNLCCKDKILHLRDEESCGLANSGAKDDIVNADISYTRNNSNDSYHTNDTTTSQSQFNDGHRETNITQSLQSLPGSNKGNKYLPEYGRDRSRSEAELKLPSVGPTQTLVTSSATKVNSLSVEYSGWETDRSATEPISSRTLLPKISLEEYQQVMFNRSLTQTSGVDSLMSSQNGSQFISPVSREISVVLKEGELKRRTYVRRNSFVGLDEKVAAFLLNSERTDNAPDLKTPEMATNNTDADNGKTQTQIQKKKKADRTGVVMRDARTRCRTCMERFRQNAEFQKRKLEMEAEKEARRMLQKRGSVKDCRLKEEFTFALSDLKSLFSDEVLDFSDEETKSKPRKQGRPRKGYSKRRLEQLAEPRRGTKKRALFSKQLIKKEVDTLTETHAQPQMTDREKEKLRVLESKVRTFLARMQEESTPLTMVHIPQRDDVMKVDISHL